MDIRNLDGYKEVLEFYNGDYLAADVWSKKYGYNEYTTSIIHPMRAWEIITRELASVQDYISEEDIYKTLKGWKFVPAGRVLHGILRHFYAKQRGEKLNIGLSNCLYMGGPEDSIESIMDYAKLHAVILKHGYGNGLNLNKLRPNGSKVSNAAMTSAGVVPFMKLFSDITNTIGHAGRRGASIITLDVSHPDIKEFILAKTHNENDITGANISVMVDDNFMKAVENDKEYELRFEFNDDRSPITKKISARELFNLIAEAAWDWGEPGLLFKDTIQNNTCLNFSEYTLPTGVNPCVTGDTLISVADGRGFVRIDELAKEGKDVLVYSLNRETGKVELKMGRHPRLTRKNAKILKVILDDGSYIRCTEDHKFILSDMTAKKAKDLEKGDSLYLQTKVLNDNYWKTNRMDDKFSVHEHRNVYLYFNNKDKNIFNGQEYVIHHKDFNPKNNNIENLEFMTSSSHDKLHKKYYNPMIHWWNEISEEKRNNYREKMSKSTSGLKNGNAIKMSKDEYKEAIRQCILYYGGPITLADWEKYAKENGYKIRNSFYDSKDLILELNHEMFNLDINRMKESYKYIKNYRDYLWLKYNYDLPVEFDNGNIYVIKKCEVCGNEFKVLFNNREKATCSSKCSRKYMYRCTINNNMIVLDKYVKYLQYNNLQHSKDSFNKFLNDNPELPSDITYFTITHYINSFNLKEEAYNHRVVKVIEDGYEDVYNITVDDNHTYGIGLQKYDKLKSGIKYYSIFSVNCGEVTMSPYTKCCLGSIMLEKFAISDFTEPWDEQELIVTVENGVKILNAVIDYELHYNLFPDDIPEIREQAKYFRQIGLGISGLADYLGLRGFGYNFNKNTKEHLKQLFEMISVYAYQTSVKVAKQKNENIISNTIKYMIKHNIITQEESDNKFTELLDKYLNTKYIEELNYNFYNYSPILESLEGDDAIIGINRNNLPINSAILSIAPTGSLSIVAGGMYDYRENKMKYTQCSSGIEPVIFRKYKRTTKIHGKDEVYDVEHWSIKVLKQLEPEIDDYEIEKLLPTIHEVNPLDKVKIQGLIQKYIDNSISSTINLPNKYTKEDVLKLYMEAWKSGCKGITVFRDGCKRTGIIVENKDDKKENKIDNEILNKEYIRPTRLYGFTEKIKFHDTPAFITLNFDNNDNPKELFMNISKSGKLIGAMSEALGRLLSLALYYNIPLDEIIKQLEEIAGGDPIWHKFENTTKPMMIKSIPDAIAKLLKQYLNKQIQINNDKLKCPKCGENTLIKSEGCIMCTNCGYSKCG